MKKNLECLFKIKITSNEMPWISQFKS